MEKKYGENREGPHALDVGPAMHGNEYCRATPVTRRMSHQIRLFDEKTVRKWCDIEK